MGNKQSSVQKIFSMSDSKITNATKIYNEWAVFDELAKSKNRLTLNNELNEAKKILEKEKDNRLEKLLEFYAIDTENLDKFKFLALALAREFVTNFDVYEIRWRPSGKDQINIVKLEHFVDGYLRNKTEPSIWQACEEAKRQFRNEQIGKKSVKTLVNWYFARKSAVKKYEKSYPDR